MLRSELKWVNVATGANVPPEEWPVSQLTGQPVDPWSEPWRHECECRSILRLPTRDQRRARLDDIKKRRGEATYLKIRRDCEALFKLMREQSGTEG